MCEAFSCMSWKGSLEAMCPIPIPPWFKAWLAKASSLIPCLIISEHLQGCKLRRLSVQPYPVFDLNIAQWGFFHMFKWCFLTFGLCPLPVVLPLNTTEKSLAALLYTVGFSLTRFADDTKPSGAVDAGGKGCHPEVPWQA